MSKKIFLDYQSTTPVSDRVLKKMLPYFTEKFANPHSNNHSFGRETNEVVEKTREETQAFSSQIVGDYTEPERRKKS